MKFRCYQCANKFDAEPKNGDHAYDITCPHCGWFKSAYKFDQVYDEDDRASIVGTRLDELLKAEAENAELRKTINAMLAQSAEHMQKMSRLWSEKR